MHYYKVLYSTQKSTILRKQSILVFVREGVRKWDFLTLLTYNLLLSSKLLPFLHSKRNKKRILPRLSFLPVGLNDAVKILFYHKSFHWMTPWHYRTLERKPNVYTTDLEKRFLHLFNEYLRADYIPCYNGSRGWKLESARALCFRQASLPSSSAPTAESGRQPVFLLPHSHSRCRAIAAALSQPHYPSRTIPARPDAC